ncbi:similar to Saccharomyces cerevisiae YBL028C Protein of unknown function that may interact with ribosomes [Maudiozyma saulgeensis]|uniref:DUF2423 domain-containing protein n=1 Tax=Maudiozyma saulgeensis TaxID=1789683 RepID=A0A1X7R4J3_9SACH|nr:similar to Saccharomyces cerevisiae YBL028C Protein of unknown function that may interact with ribosomes [Kazachstania saulgeensis]
MAKSLRASSHLNAKAIKRKAVFQKVVDARESRIADKLKKDLIEQKLKELKEKNPEAASTMDVDDLPAPKKEESKKISTSGWRDANHHVYKKNKKLRRAKKRGSFTKF